MRDSRVLLVGTDKVAQTRLAAVLRERGYDARIATSPAEASAALDDTRILSSPVDARVNETAGPDSLQRLNTERNGGEPIVVFSENERDSTVEATSPNLDPVIPGSRAPENLPLTSRHQARPRRLGARRSDASPPAWLRQETALWRSAKMQEVWDIIQQAANIDVTVLISGETGTGKDLVARAIHHLSSRQHAPYVAVNCAAVPKDLLESELFGHERGSFTGAHQLKIGKFESANHGTILLDEIGDLHPDLQAKLLHVLQDGTFSRVGGKAAMKVDVRVLAATNRNLALAVASERFRADLYYRLNVIHIMVPPLRERREEIPLLAAYFMEKYSQLYNREHVKLSSDVLARLKQHAYPGNVRELENIVKRLIVLGNVHLAKAVPAAQKPAHQHNQSLDSGQPVAVFLKALVRKAARRVEREEILKMLEQTNWNRSRTAKLLNISYRSLLYKLKDAGLDRKFPMTGLSV